MYFIHRASPFSTRNKCSFHVAAARQNQLSWVPQEDFCQPTHELLQDNNLGSGPSDCKAATMLILTFENYYDLQERLPIQVAGKRGFQQWPQVQELLVFKNCIHLSIKFGVQVSKTAWRAILFKREEPKAKPQAVLGITSKYHSCSKSVCDKKIPN